MVRQFIGLIAYVALFAALLFGAAGTVRWRAGWILLAVVLVVRGLSTLRLYAVQRSLLVERSKLPLQSGQLSVDRVLLLALMATFAGVIAFAAADRWHLHLFEAPPTAIRVAGLGLFALGSWIVHLALAANAYAVTVVRYQGERGHAVVDTGPYRVVRHPMYAGLPLVMLGIALWLGSVAAAIATLIPLALLVVRILVEERMLRARLDGYEAYTARVPWRLAPRVW